MGNCRPILYDQCRFGEPSPSRPACDPAAAPIIRITLTGAPYRCLYGMDYRFPTMKRHFQHPRPPILCRSTSAHFSMHPMEVVPDPYGLAHQSDWIRSFSARFRRFGGNFFRLFGAINDNRAFVLHAAFRSCGSVPRSSRFRLEAMRRHPAQ